MVDQALKLVIDVAFGLVTFAFLLRFLMQLLRAPFRNPFGQAVLALTDWLVVPLRKMLPGFRASTGRRSSRPTCSSWSGCSRSTRSSGGASR